MSIRFIASGVCGRSVRAWLWSFAVWLVCGCSGVERPSLSIESLAPNRVSSRAETPVVVRGQHFDDAVAQIDLSSTSAPRIDRKWRVSLEDVPGDLDAMRVDASTLRFTVPAGLDARSYAVTVISPAGVEVTRPRALTVADEAPEFVFSIETQADGLGEVVSDRELANAESLALYAVVRTPAGDIVSGDFEVRWRATGLAEVLSESRGRSTIFASERAGSAVVIAESSALGEARTGTLRVRAADATTIEIEDAPSGTGRAVEGRLLTTDEVLSVYAVSRDPFGNFVADVDVRWNLSGDDIGTTSSERGSSLSLELTRPGTGVIRAEHDLGRASTGRLVVGAGRAATLEVEPSTASLNADDDPLRFSLSARDADGNRTSNFGDVVFTVETGEISALDPKSGVLDPAKAGSGVILATSSHGPVARTGEISIEPGRVARLEVAPDTLSRSADEAPVTFEATAFDADDNRTTDTGALAFSIASGPIAALDPVSGKLDPKVAGSGTVRVASSYGPSDVSDAITIRPGRAAALSIIPKTLTTQIGAAPTMFSAVATDADGNLTLDTGNLSYAVASGPIEALDAVSGKLTPTVAGQGVVRVTSSLGPVADSGAIVVRPLGPIVEISTMSAPTTISRGQGLARVLVKIDNHSPDQTAFLSSVRLSFLRGGVSVDSDYGLFVDTRNSYRLAPSSSTTFVVYVSASASAASGTIEVNAHLDAFVPGIGEIDSDGSTTFTMLTSSAPSAVIVASNDRMCAGTSMTFNGANSSFFVTRFAWSFENGTPATSTLESPSSVVWSAPGRHLFSLTVSDSSGDQDSVYGPVFVGTAGGPPSTTYPTGAITFEDPASGEVIDLTELPADVFASSTSGGEDLRQCNGTVVAPTGNRFVTLWTDRGVLDPTQDVRPSLPGIQVALTTGGVAFDQVDLLPGSPELEGVATVYAEYFEPTLGVVTAAGDRTFYLDNDTEPPSIVASRPASDCTNCFSSGWPWVFQFNEPINPAMLANVTVQYKASPLDCSIGAFANVTANSTLAYDAAARTLYVRPPVYSGPHTLRVLLSGVRDASSNANQLPSLARCAIVNPPADVAVAAAPTILGLGANPFSPDGDGQSDTVQLTARVGAEARIVRLEITRGPSDVRTLLQFVNDSGDVTFTWDGRDYTGRMVPDGIYRYELAVENAEGEASESVVGMIEVDSAVHFAGVSARY